MVFRKEVGVGTSVAAAGDGAGVAVVTETDGDETCSEARVDEGKLVANSADKGDGATVGSGGAVGAAAEQAKPATAVNASINVKRRIFKIWYGLQK